MTFKKITARVVSLVLLSAISALACSMLQIPQGVDGHPNCKQNQVIVRTSDSVIFTTKISCYDSVRIQNGQTVPFGKMVLTQTIDSTVKYRQNAIHILALRMESGEFWQVKRERNFENAHGNGDNSYPMYFSPASFHTMLDSDDVDFPKGNIFSSLLDTTDIASISYAKNFFLPYLRSLSSVQYSWDGENILHGISYPTGTLVPPITLSPDASDSAAWNGLRSLSKIGNNDAVDVQIATAKSVQRWSRALHSLPEPFSFKPNKLWIVALDNLYDKWESCKGDTGFVGEGASAMLYLSDSLLDQPTRVAQKISASMNLNNTNPYTGLYVDSTIWTGEKVTVGPFSFEIQVLDSVAQLTNQPPSKPDFSSSNAIMVWPEYKSVGIRSTLRQTLPSTFLPQNFFDLLGRQSSQDR